MSNLVLITQCYKICTLPTTSLKLSQPVPNITTQFFLEEGCGSNPS